MGIKRALSVLAFALFAGAIGSAVIVGTSASGATRPPAAAAPQQPVTVVPPVTVAPQQQAMPKTTLHLPSTLKLVNRTSGAKSLDSSHSVFSAGLTKPGHRKIIGTAAYSCAIDSSAGLKQDCRGALALRNGVILVHQVLDIHTHQITGEVTGGSGYYEGAQGTVSGRDLGGGKDRLTIDYAFE